MKTIISIVLVFTATTVSAQFGELSISISNIKETKGKIRLGIFNKKENFPKEGKEYKKLVLDVEATTLNYTVKHLPQGEYAIAVFHDENVDEKCNTNLLGIPKEGYGFSNNVKPLLRAPSFEKAKFRLGAQKSIRIHLIY